MGVPELARMWVVLALVVAPMTWADAPNINRAQTTTALLRHDETVIPTAAPQARPAARSQRLAQGNGYGNGNGNGNGRKNGMDNGVEVWLVDVTVNGQRMKTMARAERSPDGSILLPASTWIEARLAQSATPRTLSDGTAAFAINEVDGATWTLNPQTQSLEIRAPASAFLGSTLGLRGGFSEPPARPVPGILLNYDVTASQTHNYGRPASGLALEAVAFNGFGTLVTSGIVRHDGWQSKSYRLDSFWRYDLPHRMATVVVGDTVGVSGGWSRPARYAGVRFGRDFSMRPGFITQPQLSLTGEATLPSTVDVLIDNARRYSQPVQPGPFDLTNVPMTSGAGEVNLVVRDLLGRETVVTQSYYLSPRLLAPGLSDFSFEAGWMRRGYGESDSYDRDPFGAITWRQGLRPNLTGEARLELQPDRQAAGVDINTLLGDWAAARLAIAASTRKYANGTSETGQLLQFGFERSAASLGYSFQYEHATRGFSPFGEASLSSTHAAYMQNKRSRDTLFLGAGGTLSRKLRGSLSYVHRESWDGEIVRALGGSLSWSAWRHARVLFSLNKRLDDTRDWRAALTLNMPLGSGVSAYSRVERRTDGEMATTLAAQRNVPAGPGLGWNVETTYQDISSARAGLQYNTSLAEWSAEVSTRSGGDWGLRLGGRGSVGWLAGVPFASRPVGNTSFAVVDVAGLAGIPVMRHHQVVAYTNEDGKAFIPGLLPWQPNTIEIDPVDLPLDVEVGEMTNHVTPYPRSGALVKFDVRKSRQVLVTLVQPDGEPVPAGALVRVLPDGPDFFAGRRGRVWLTDLAEAQPKVRVRWNGAKGCVLTLEVPESSAGTPGLLGPLTCGAPMP